MSIPALDTLEHIPPTPLLLESETNHAIIEGFNFQFRGNKQDNFDTPSVSQNRFVRHIYHDIHREGSAIFSFSITRSLTYCPLFLIHSLVLDITGVINFLFQPKIALQRIRHEIFDSFLPCRLGNVSEI